MKIKNIIKLLVVAIFCVMFSYGNNVWADNSDTPFEFWFNSSQQQTYASAGRRKYDSTSVYMYCSEAVEPYFNPSDLKYYGTVHGSYSLNGSYYDCYYGSLHSTTYVFKMGNVKYMSNYVNESNRKYARIYVQKNGTGATFRGVWSPDSI